jgi:regulator of protease activity HflC (stomatin/prohibitin superfamily)
LEGITAIKVADAWEAVVGSLQEKEVSILNAESYALAKVPSSHAEATNIVLSADSQGRAKPISLMLKPRA